MKIVVELKGERKFTTHVTQDDFESFKTAFVQGSSNQDFLITKDAIFKYDDIVLINKF